MRSSVRVRINRDILHSRKGWIVKDLHGSLHDVFKTRDEARTRLRAHKLDQKKQHELVEDTETETDLLSDMT
jgi:hypothetical protein